MAEEVIGQYSAACERYYEPFMRDHEYMLEHYLVNFVFRNLFPFNGEESLFVLSGTGTLLAAGVEHALDPGRCAFIPRGVAHAVKVTGAEALVAVFASAPLAPNPQVGHRDLQAT